MSIVLIKPDAIQRGLMGILIHEYESHYEIKQLVMVQPTRQQLDEHYAEHQGKVFYHDLIAHMLGGPLVVLRIGCGLGGLYPHRYFTFDLREKYGANKTGPANLLHCSDSPEAARRELEIWFPQ